MNADSLTTTFKSVSWIKNRILKINHSIYELKESYTQHNLLNRASCFYKWTNFKSFLISALNPLKWRPFRTLQLFLRRMPFA